MGSLLGALNPYAIYIKVAAVLAAALALFLFGHHVAALECKAGQLAAERKVEAAQMAEAKKFQAASAELEELRNAQRTRQQAITKFVDRVVDRPIYRNVCFDADGVRSINDAIARTSPNSGQPDTALPATAPAH